MLLLFLAILPSMLQSQQPSGSDRACQVALQTTTLLAKCSFVIERSGLQYYLLEFDREAVKRSYKEVPKGQRWLASITCA
jgi:hypothetical protein